MTQEEKNLLLKDLCARLPYGVKCQHFKDKTPYALLGIDEDVLHIDCPVYDEGDGYVEIEYCKPYLRPMSSMTEEEKETYRIIIKSLLENSVTNNIATLYNFLNSKHLDYNGLIHLGLAIEVAKENNPYEKEQKEK